MGRNKQKRVAEPGAHVGSASIVMIFAVLCLTIFAVLSFATADAEYRLAKKTAAAAEAYYKADGAAEDTYLALCMLLQTEQDEAVLQETFDAMQVAAVQREHRRYLQYAVPVDDTQRLQVTLLWEKGRLQITQWCVEAAEPWVYDDTLQVWDGAVDITE